MRANIKEQTSEIKDRRAALDLALCSRFFAGTRANIKEQISKIKDEEHL
jgi:hypothetical protein